MSLALTPAQLAVARNVVAVARAFSALTGGVPELVHLAVAYNESSWDDQAVGDGGQSFGPYQIYQVAHPNTSQLAISPWANYAFHVCAGPWQQAWQVYGGQWGTVANRPAVLEAFAPLAQGSVAWPAGRGAECYSAAMQAYEAVS